MSGRETEERPLWKVIAREFPSRFATGKNKRLATIAVGLLEAGLKVEYHVISASGVVPEPVDLELWEKFENLIYWEFGPRESQYSYEEIEGIDCRFSESIPESCGRNLEESRFDGVLFTAVDLVPSLWKYCSDSIPRVLEMDEMETGRVEEFTPLNLPPLSDLERRNLIAKGVLEKIWIPRFDLVVFSSQKEVEKASEAIQGKPATLAVWPNIADPAGVDLPREPSANLSLFYVGHLGYPPNQDAVLWLAEEIFPLILKRYPDARCRVAGLRCPDSLSERLGRSKVEYLGAPADLQPLYASATAAIVPLRAGSGTRIKILESFALGCPVVSTTKGAEGLGVTAERELMIADDTAGLVEACIRIYEDSSLQEKMITLSRAFWEQGYNQKLLNSVIAQDLGKL